MRIVASIVGLLAACLVLWLVMYEAAHPCVRTEQSVCEMTYCAMHMTDPNGNMYCTMYHTSQYPCEVCVERKP